MRSGYLGKRERRRVDKIAFVRCFFFEGEGGAPDSHSPAEMVEEAHLPINELWAQDLLLLIHVRIEVDIMLKC